MTAKEYNLERFIKAQEVDYAIALSEVKKGKKHSHWMWYIFPQLQGLGFSATSRYYDIKDRAEAAAFLQDPILGNRLIAISTAFLELDTTDAHAVFGSPDDLKLQSSITLFAELPATDYVFQKVLDKYFNGVKNKRTLQIIDNHLS